MDDRRAYLEPHGRRMRHSVDICHMLSVGLHMTGDRPYRDLIAEGHYRCPHCRRADITETSAQPARPRGQR